MAHDDLTNIFISSGVNEKMEGFCTVSINGGNLLGQLSPTEVRNMALQWLEAAEAAETDAIVFSMLREINIPDETIGGFIAKMRDKRAES